MIAGIFAAMALEVISVTPRGAGCPAGSTFAHASPDGSAFTVLFSTYYVAVEASHAGGRASNRCDVDLVLRVPAGQTFAVDTLSVRGFASLEGEAFGDLSTTVSYPPRSTLVRLPYFSLTAPYADDFAMHAPVVSRAYAPCLGTERRITVQTSASLIARPYARGLVAVDSVDGELAREFRLLWKRCTI